MLLIISITIFLSVLLIMHLYEQMQGKDFIYIEEGIASEVSDYEVHLTPPRKLKKHCVIHSGSRMYLLSPKTFIPSISGGTSMEYVGISKGDLVLLNPNVSTKALKKGDIVAIRMPSDAKKNAGKLKFRVFSHLKKDETGELSLALDKFNQDTGKLVPSLGKHKLNALVGVKETVFDKAFTNKFLMENTLH